MANRWWQNEQRVEENTKEQTIDDLFVFGYACKLFRDDDRAKFIDDEKHLIPWMGNDSLLIDRYDGRGHLYDLRNYDVANVSNEPVFLTDEERQVELACEEERYLEMRVDLAEQATYEEEEWKRYYEAVNNDGTYNAVRFSYDYNEQQQELEPEIAEEEVPFEAPEELKVPPGLVVPPTEKVNAIITKTAKFLAEHGVQMEIMIKMKQKNNSQFEFLEHDNELCAYFRHMVQMIKSGKYKPKEAPPDPSELERQNSSYEEEEDYLHPSLFAPRSDSPAPKPVPKPVVSVYDTSYGQLIKSMQSISKETPTIVPPPLPPHIAKERQERISAQAATKVVKHPPIIKQEIPDQLASDDLPVPQEGSGSDSENVPQGPQIIPPPPELQPIVDRMAQYVAKNGADFETVVKSKDDPRFQFIQSWHQHYPYYEYKKNIFIKEKANAESKQKPSAQKGISFSLKGKSKDQENSTLDKRKAFAGHSSDEEEGNSTDERQGHRVDRDSSGVSTPDTQPDDSSELDSNKHLQPVAISDDLIKKQAEEKLKDRLASAARDKLAQTTKDQQVKADRKRKAAMFVNLLKTSTPTTDTSSQNGKSNNDTVEVESTTNGSLQDPITVDADPDVMIVDPPESFSDAQVTVAKTVLPSRSKPQSSAVSATGKGTQSATTSRSSSPTNSKHVIEYSHGLRAPKRAVSPPSAYKLQRRSRSRSPKSSSSAYKLGSNSRQLAKRRSRSPTYKTSKTTLSSSSSTLSSAKHKSDSKLHSKLSSSSKSSSLASKSSAKHSQKSRSRSKEQNRKRHRSKSRSKSPIKKSSKSSSSSKTSSSSRTHDRDKKSHSSSGKHKLFKPIPELPKSKSKSKTESSKSKHSNSDDKPAKTNKHRVEKSSKRLVNGDDSEKRSSADERLKDVHVIDDDDVSDTPVPVLGKEHIEQKKKIGRLRSVLKQSRREVLRDSTKLFIDELT